eukprot:6782189-Pyramimonas_sp.AAC.1
MAHPSETPQSLARAPTAALSIGSSPTLASSLAAIGYPPLSAVLPSSSAISVMWRHAARVGYLVSLEDALGLRGCRGGVRPWLSPM